MSERGSFCTEYIYCDKCLYAVERVVSQQGDLTAIRIPTMEGGSHLLPIIAGKVASTYAGGELQLMEALIEDLEKELCHPVDIAVLPDAGGARILTAMPQKDEHNLTRYEQFHDRNYWWSETKCRQCGMLLEAEGDLFSKSLSM